jgi:Tol biopolymer transport system component
MSILRRVACAGAVAILSPMIAAAPAHAAHPGSKGLIAFVRTVDGHSHLFTISSDGTAEQQLTFAANADDYAADWSPDGTKIAFERRLASGRYQIFVIKPGSGQPAANIGNSATDDTDPSWGPSGHRIAFARAGAIWRMRADGAQQHRVTHSLYHDWDPSWSSTGDLAFVRCCPPGWDWSIYVRRAGSDTAQRFVGRRDNGEGSDSAYSPDWSPDGSTLAYTDFGGYSDGGDSLILTTTDGTSYSGFDIPCDYCDPSDPAWSPDGQLVAFDTSNHADEGVGPVGLFTVPSCACNTPPTSLAPGGRDPAWQPVQPS